MALKRWKKVKQEFELKNPWWTYRRDEVHLPSGKSGEYHYVHVIGSSMIIPVRNDGTLILVNQYRYLMGRESVEFPCGGVKEGSTYEHTAHEELGEETGFHAGELDFAGEFNPYNGVTDEMCRVYIARSLTAIKVEKDDTEEFEYLYPTPPEVDAMIASGTIWDGMSLAAWSLVRNKFLGAAV
jgi:ADP-ribose pyrophosphatase